MMKYFYRKKQQAEKQGTPYSIFKVKRVGVSKAFDVLNKRTNNALVRESTYPIYYKFAEEDLPYIYKELINMYEGQRSVSKTYGWALETDGFFVDFINFGDAEIEHVTDYEYDITYEILPQSDKKKDFSSLNRITFEGVKS